MFTDDTISMVLVSLNVDMWYPSLDLQMIPPSNSYMPPLQNQMCPNDTTKMKVSFIVWLMLILILLTSQVFCCKHDGTLIVTLDDGGEQGVESEWP
jgi:hypothetical protein